MHHRHSIIGHNLAGRIVSRPLAACMEGGVAEGKTGAAESLHLLGSHHHDRIEAAQQRQLEPVVDPQ